MGFRGDTAMVERQRVESKCLLYRLKPTTYNAAECHQHEAEKIGMSKHVSTSWIHKNLTSETE